ncbi:iron ABC transporter permease [Lactococcus fujiensis]|uniref:iron ABC transporter permease n=1 Tax=Lactococcus fujiensis TaxID=610251 RepID=UPI000A44A6D3|nr:iron ABC transporter permease [Lactococcus fujiensis]
MTKSRYYLLISSLLFLIIGLSVIYLLVGDQNYPLSALTSQPIILQLRLPRLFGVILVGILLSISGFLVQLMTKNPIAELSTLGISGGASLGMSILLAFGLSTNAGFSALVASIGAFVALFLVISLTARTHFQPLKVILVGTSVGLLQRVWRLPLLLQNMIPSLIFLWIVGSFSGMTQTKVILLGFTTLIFIILLILFANSFRILNLGDEMARSLGLSVNQVRTVMMIMVAMVAGATVSSVGVISFVGLIAPHLAKKVVRSNFWQGIVLSALTAIILLICADFVARNMMKPYEFPAGSLTMLMGAPFFIWVMSQEAK